jgi:hypothetical protein
VLSSGAQNCGKAMLEDSRPNVKLLEEGEIKPSLIFFAANRDSLTRMALS